MSGCGSNQYVHYVRMKGKGPVRAAAGASVEPYNRTNLLEGRGWSAKNHKPWRGVRGSV